MALRELVCPTHPIETTWENDTMAKIALADPETFSGNRDFILNYRLVGEEIQSGLLLFEGQEEIRNPENQSEDVSQPLPLPLNVSNLAVGVSVSTVSEPEISFLLIGVALVLAALMVFKKNFRRLHRQPQKGFFLR